MSENIDGALAFKATLDINDFNVSSEAMERRIISVSDTAVQESARMEQSILNFAQNGARYIVSYLVGNGMMSLVNSIVQTRGQFQQLEIAFGTMLGNEQKAKALMDQMVDTAAKTPFDLMGVAGGAKQLLAYGTAADKVNDTLVRLGNIASGLSIPLQDIVYLYGTTMVQGRLYAQDVRQFTGRGIPLVKELAAMYGKTAEEINTMVSEGKIGFPEVEKVLNKLTNSGGQFFNLMEKQSSSLTGMIANLGDAWDTALNKLGEDNQDVFASGISGATYLVENFDEILRIVKAITIAYGSYKAAIVLNTLATKGYTGVALLDNTVRQAKMALMKADEALTGKTAAATNAMTAAQEAHTASLQKQLTVEEQANLVKRLRIATIQQLLTAQQQEYLSNLGVTASSQNYEAVATGVLSLEQRQALSKTDLSSKSAIYRAALEREVAVKVQGKAVTLDTMRADVKAAAARVESAKQSAVVSMQAVESARYELYWAKQSGDATRIATAEKKLEGAVENQAISRKAALAAQTDFYAKKKLLEATATKQSTIASVSDTTAKTTQGAVTSLLTAITTRCTLAMKSLWLAMKTNPIGWILTLVGALVSVITLFASSQDEATDAMGEFQDTTKKEIDNLNMLMAVLKNTEAGTKAHKQALEKVNAILQDYNKELVTESSTVQELKGKYDELTIAINESAAARIKAKYIEQIQSDKEEKQNEATGDFKKDIRNTTRVSSKKTMFGDFMSYDDVEGLKNLSDATFDLIEAYVKTQAEELKKLSGDEYKKAVKQVEQTITKILKDASKEDFTGVYFLDKISGYINKIAQPAKEAEGAMEKLNEQVNAGRDAMNGVKDAVPIDYLKMSFSDLDKLVKDTQTEIDTINAKKLKVETDNTRLTELLGIIGQVKTAISTKETNLNTESGINARIKQLQDERANVEINSKKYNELTDKIKTFQKRLPDNSKNADENAAKKAEQLAEKQRQADMKLEAARIEIMEDGYAKRKALLDLQHKKALADIDKEEKELERARKEAGKGGLSTKEKQTFTDRRSVEEQSYQKAQNKLFDGEIEYKKSQYQLYFRWVQNMGKDVADKQFSSLLKEGNSYKDYVEKQIQALKQKQASGTLSEGEGNQLVTLNMQYSEITGAKTAMDLFKESVNQAIGRASTLAEKLQAVADAKERLANGGTGLVGADEQAEANLFISEKDIETNKELQDKVLTEFKTYEEQKKQIQDEYALLRLQSNVQNNAELLAQVNKGEAEALSALNAQMLMQTDSWSNLFSDLDSLTVDQIDKLITEIQQKMSTADLKLNPADMKAVLDKLDEAKRKILDTNPFKSLGNAIKSVFGTAEQKSKHSSGNIKTDWKNLANATDACFDFVLDAVDSCDVLKDLIGDTGASTIQMVQGVATAGIAMGAAIKTAEKGSIILAAISIALQAIQWIAGLFNNDDKLEEKIQNIQSEINALSNAFDRLQHAADQTYWVSNDQDKAAHQQRLDDINQQIAALEKQAVVARASWNFVKYAQLTKQIKELKYALEKEEGKGDMFQLYELQKQSLREQQELIKQQIAAEKDKKKTDNDKIAEWEEAIKDIDTQLEDLERDMLENLAGTDVKSAIDEFADALVDAYCKGEDAAKALGEVTKNVMKKAVVEAIKRQFLAKAINDAVLYLGESMKDGVLSDSERRNFENMVNAAGAVTNKALEAVGDWIKDIEEDTTEDPLTGAVTAMSEQTGSVVAGRLNAFVINQTEQTTILRQSLLYQQATATNTGVSASELKEIKDTLKRIENKDSSLLSQGIA
ncbi:tape measure protein [Bacteroides thetaiotaomicron]|uniref:tape measure protein n=1 Tax=Bacteroides thetaiotaomicron TaxID=818 RepID=UPI00232E1107|nr:tape measure protein [Bacteroides thetaiotaomicron]MDC2194959.1 tape measure protein [Bacteroides thetaiotaomicron]